MIMAMTCRPKKARRLRRLRPRRLRIRPDRAYQCSKRTGWLVKAFGFAIGNDADAAFPLAGLFDGTPAPGIGGGIAPALARSAASGSSLSPWSARSFRSNKDAS